MNSLHVPMFAGPLAALSNFDATPYLSRHLGLFVRSGEHDFNAAKTLDPAQRDWVLSAPTPAEAKRRGRRVALRPGWDQGGRVRAMQTVLLGKFDLTSRRGVLHRSRWR